MKRNEMVKSHEEFNEIINSGKKLSSKYFNVFVIHKDYPKPNFGIAVGKKMGNAVTRNKYKRQIRNIIDKNRFFFKNNNNYIIMIKRDAEKISYQELEQELLKVLGKDYNE